MAQLVVGINTQISPRYPGGSETMALSLIRKLGEVPRPERFVLCAVRKHAKELVPFVGKNETILEWPFRQVGFPYPETAGSRWTRLRARAGRLGPALDTAQRWYVDVLRNGLNGYRDPSARKADPVLRASGVEVVHFPYALCFGTKLPFVYEPWDLQHRHYPQFFSAQHWRWRDRLYRKACERARVVITATRWVKDDIVRQFGLSSSKIAVIPRSSLLARNPLPEPERREAWERHRIPDPFLFYPAMTFPHKNHIRLLRALAHLRDKRGMRLPLVCSGRIFEPHWPEVAAEITRLALADQVTFLGPVSEPLLASLFQNARLLVFPSLFEGLGAPLLEAMHHRLPIAAADATSIPEVAGGAAVLFDAHDPEAIAEAVARVLGDPEVMESLRTRGDAVLARLSWERAVQTFIACYRAAAGRPLADEHRQLLGEAIGA